MVKNADFLEWNYDLPEDDRLGIYEARRQLITDLLEDPEVAISIESMVEPPVNMTLVYKVIGALTLLKEGFLEMDSESERLVLTNGGQRFADGILTLRHS
jgi:hypothetical protein